MSRTRSRGCWSFSACPDSTWLKGAGWVGWDCRASCTAFTGTYLIAVTGNFGFLAPVLAKKSPAVLDAITQYPPVVGINGLAAITFMVGYLLFGVAMIRTASLPRLAGILVAVGAPAHLIGFGLAQLVSPALWWIAVAGSVSLGAGLAWPGYRLWHPRAAAGQFPVDVRTRP